MLSLDDWNRTSIIRDHNFFYAQAEVRILNNFSDESISEEADRAEAEFEIKTRDYYSSPDADPADFYESQRDEGIIRYTMMCELRDKVRFVVVAGFFNEWEKKVRAWLSSLKKEYPDAKNYNKINNCSISSLFDFFELIGWPIKSKHYFTTLDACRLIVNVSKHGDGLSFKKLCKLYPEFIHNPFYTKNGPVGIMSVPRVENMKITNEDIEKFSNAIVSFWQDVPEVFFLNKLEKPILDFSSIFK